MFRALPLLGFLLFAAASSCFAQKTDKRLQKSLDTLVAGFEGTVGIYVQNLNTGRVASINSDTVFPTASIVKVPIMIGVMDQINRGALSYHQVMTFKDSLRYSASDMLASFRHDERIELSKLLLLMMSMSDNTASLWLQQLAGTGTRINALLDSFGLQQTRVNSRTEGRAAYREQYGWGQTTPREMATLVSRIYKGEIISQAASEAMLRLMNRNYFDKVSISQLPPYVTVFAKYGAVNASRSEVVLVKGKKATYVFCIATKNNKDQSWKNNNAAWVLTRNLSRLLWNYFEPEDKWEAPDGASLFQ